jgi:hypothetical protein
MPVIEMTEFVGVGLCQAVVGYVFGASGHNEVKINFTLPVPIQYPDKRITIAALMASSAPLCSIALGPLGELELQNYNYFDPEETPTHFPGPEVYPNVGTYPNTTQPPVKRVLRNSQSQVEISLIARGFNTAEGETDLYAEKINEKGKIVSGNGYSTLLNWVDKVPDSVLLGVVSARDTTYHLTMTDMRVYGESPSDNDFYYAAGHHGLGIDAADNGVLWRGARQIEDPSTYSELTPRIGNLVRYNYVQPDRPLVSAPKGLRWELPPS